MELRHLRYFVAVAEALSFTRAAVRLGIAQPPLSQQIQQLEKEIGFLLFDRLPKGTQLTDVGVTFLDEAREILQRTETALDHARRVGRGEIGLLRLGFSAAASFHPFVPSFVRSYRERYPAVRLVLTEGYTVELTRRLAEQSLDLVLVRSPYPPADDFIGERVVDEDMVAALPADHRLRQASSIDLAQLADDNFILFPRHVGAGLYDRILSACIEAGFSPHVDQEAPQLTSIIHLVAAGLGVAIVPASMSEINAPGIVYKTITGPAPRACLDVVYPRKNASVATINAVSLMRQVTGLTATGPGRPKRNARDATNCGGNSYTAQ